MKKDIIFNATICDFCLKDKHIGNSECFICGKDVCYSCSDRYHASLPSEDEDDITYIEIRVCPDCKENIPENIQTYIKDVDSFDSKYQKISDEFSNLVFTHRELKHQ